MPHINVYVPRHLYKRRHELPPEESFSGLFNDALERRLDELDVAKNEQTGADIGVPKDVA